MSSLLEQVKNPVLLKPQIVSSNINPSAASDVDTTEANVNNNFKKVKLLDTRYFIYRDIAAKDKDVDIFLAEKYVKAKQRNKYSLITAASVASVTALSSILAKSKVSTLLKNTGFLGALAGVISFAGLSYLNLAKNHGFIDKHVDNSTQNVNGSYSNEQFLPDCLPTMATLDDKVKLENLPPAVNLDKNFQASDVKPLMFDKINKELTKEEAKEFCEKRQQSIAQNSKKAILPAGITLAAATLGAYLTRTTSLLKGSSIGAGLSLASIATYLLVNKSSRNKAE